MGRKLLIIFKNIFKPKKPSAPITVKPVPPISEIPTKEEVESFPTNPNSKIKKVAIIIGHGNGDSGAEGWNGIEEFDYNSMVARTIEASNIGKEVKLFWRGPSGIAGVAAKAMAWRGDITIEMHLNAYNGSAKGCCVLTLSDKVSIEYGRSFSKAFCKKFNRVMRDGDGVVELGSSDRGHFSLACVNDPAPSVLIEPFFIDNKDEWIEPGAYANFLMDWISSL